MAEEKYIKKIQLSNGQVYYIYDVNAARASELDNYLLKSGGTMTGDLTIDAALQANSLKVVSVDDRKIAVTNVLTQNTDGAIQKRDADNLLEDIGGISYSMDESTGLLSFKFGRQSNE